MNNLGFGVLADPLDTSDFISIFILLDKISGSSLGSRLSSEGSDSDPSPSDPFCLHSTKVKKKE